MAAVRPSARGGAIAEAIVTEIADRLNFRLPPFIETGVRDSMTPDGRNYDPVDRLIAVLSIADVALRHLSNEVCECGHSYHDHDEETAECQRVGCDCAKCDCGNPGPLELPPLRHGFDCGKVPHEAEGYLHSATDDGPYDVDGVRYCGRCHEALAGDPRH